jgi:hypothetical protein
MPCNRHATDTMQPIQLQQTPYNRHHAIDTTQPTPCNLQRANLRESPLSRLNSSTASLPVFSMTGARATRLPLGSSTDSVISVCARLPVRNALPNYLPTFLPTCLPTFLASCLPSYPRDALRLWFERKKGGVKLHCKHCGEQKSRTFRPRSKVV